MTNHKSNIIRIFSLKIVKNIYKICSWFFDVLIYLPSAHVIGVYIEYTQRIKMSKESQKIIHYLKKKWLVIFSQIWTKLFFTLKLKRDTAILILITNNIFLNILFVKSQLRLFLKNLWKGLKKIGTPLVLLFTVN